MVEILTRFQIKIGDQLQGSTLPPGEELKANCLSKYHCCKGGLQSRAENKLTVRTDCKGNRNTIARSIAEILHEAGPL